VWDIPNCVHDVHSYYLLRVVKVQPSKDQQYTLTSL